MKTKIFLIAIFILPMSLMAQVPTMEKLYNRLSGQERFTSVNISKEMFELIASFDMQTDEMDDEESALFKEIISNMKGMKILNYSKVDKNDTHFYDIIKSSFDFKTYKELMTVKEEDKDVKFLIKKQGDKISDVIMFLDGNEETVLMNFAGLFDMKAVGKISNIMQGKMKE